MFSDILSKEVIMEKITNHKAKVTDDKGKVSLDVVFFRLTYLAGQHIMHNEKKKAEICYSLFTFLSGITPNDDLKEITFLDLLKEKDKKLISNTKKLEEKTKKCVFDKESQNLNYATQNNINTMKKLLIIHDMIFENEEKAEANVLSKIDRNCNKASTVINNYHKFMETHKPTQNNGTKSKQANVSIGRVR